MIGSPKKSFSNMAYLQRRFVLLVQPSFRWFAISCLTSAFSFGLSHIAMTWLVLEADNSVSAVTYLMASFWLPTVLLGPWFGVIADRYSRKRLLVLANGLRGVFLMGFGGYFQTHAVTAPLLYTLAFFLGCCFSIFLPAAVALIRETVKHHDLLYANSTIDIAFEVGNVAGMGLAGLIILKLTSQGAILLSGLIFMISTYAMGRVTVISERPILTLDNIVAQLYKDFKSGLSYLHQNPKLIVIYSVQLLILSAFMTSPVLLAPFAKNILHANVSQFGLIDAGLSVGVIVGGLLTPWWADRWGLMRISYVLCISLAIFFGIFSFNRDIVGAMVLYFCLGLGLSVWPLLITQAQNLTHLDFQARLQSLFSSLSSIIILMIYVLLNMGSHLISIRGLYILNVFLTLLAAYLLWRYRMWLKDSSQAVLEIDSQSFHD